jgi:hypothetical protein
LIRRQIFLEYLPFAFDCIVHGITELILENDLIWLFIRIRQEDKLSLYVALKKCDELSEAEKLKSILDEHKCHLIYGANKPDSFVTHLISEF